MSRLVLIPLLLLPALVAGSPTWASELYFTQWRLDGAIHRVDLDTMEIETLIPSGLTYPYRIAIDPIGQRMYWTSTGTGTARTIQRANLDGSELETIVDSGLPVGIAVDGLAGKVYFSWHNMVWRANLDGSNAEVIRTLVDCLLIQDLALDTPNGKVYIANWSGGTGSCGDLRRMDLDGSNLEYLATDILNGPIGLTVDSEAGKVYWGKNAEAADSGRIMRANLDGTDRESVIAYIDPDSLALDLVAGRVYWSDLDDIFPPLGTIQRVNFDGSGHETLPFDQIRIGGIAIVSDTGPSCPGDLDGDNDVDIANLAQLLGHYGLTEGATYEDGDLDGDADVDISDLAGLLGLYGTICE